MRLNGECMNDNKYSLIKLYFLFFLLVLILPFVNSQGVGVGINTYSIVLDGSILDSYVVSPKLINPSTYEIKVKVYFDCRDCTTDVKLFGHKIAEKTIDYRSFFTIPQNDFTVPPMTYGESGPTIVIRFSPRFILKNHLKIYTPGFINFFLKVINKKYENSFSVPYFTLFLGERRIKGLLVADVYESNFGVMGVRPSVGSSLEMTARGMPVSSFIFLLILIILLVVLILRKVGFEPKHIFKKRKK